MLSSPTPYPVYPVVCPGGSPQIESVGSMAAIAKPHFASPVDCSYFAVPQSCASMTASSGSSQHQQQGAFMMIVHPGTEGN